MHRMFVCLAAAFAAPAEAQLMPSAEHDPATSPSLNLQVGSEPDVANGQVFLATVGGPLHSIVVRIRRMFDHDLPYRVELHATDDDNRPLGDPLVSQWFDASLVPRSALEDPPAFEFDEPVTLDPDTAYAFSLSTVVDNDGHTTLIPVLIEPDEDYPYPFFRMFASGPSLQDDWAMYFTVYVGDAVPVTAASWGDVKRAF